MMAATALALLCSVMWGTYDFGCGLVSRRASFWSVVLVGMGMGGLAMLLVVIFLRRPLPSAGTILVLALGGVLVATASFAYFRAVTFTKMSVAAPIVAGAAAVPVVWGFASGEHPSAVQLVGISATLVGIVAIALPGPAASDEDMPVTLTGVLLAIVSSLCSGLMVVALDYGAASDPFWAAAGVRCTAAVWAMVWVGAMRPRLHLKRNTFLVITLLGLLGVAATLVFAEAMTLADLSIVAVLAWIGPAITILWARLFLREHLRPMQVAAVGAVLAGVILMTAG
jgi:drug/metabolite transporter (DMT)-like permease